MVSVLSECLSCGHIVKESKFDSFYIFKFMSFPPSGILQTYNGLLKKIGFIRLIGRALRLVFSKVMVSSLTLALKKIGFFFNHLL